MCDRPQVAAHADEQGSPCEEISEALLGQQTSQVALGSRPRKESSPKSVGQPCPIATGIGASIASMSGSRWGCVISEDRRSWHLQNGRAARKAMEGKTWRWVEASADASPSALSFHSPPWSEELSPSVSIGCSPFLLPAPSEPLLADDDDDGDTGLCLPEPAVGVGGEVLSTCGRSWGKAIAEESNCWRLEDGRVAKKGTKGKKWQWALDVRASSSNPASPVAHSQEGLAGIVGDMFMVIVCNFLPLSCARRLTISCRAWSMPLAGHLPLLLPPPQMDALLQFCLLEVLVNFDDSRLPLPMSAVYNEMLLAGRRAATCATSRERMETLVCRRLGPACKTLQEQFLQDLRPHHVDWEPDVKNSGFKSLEKLAKHFHSERLIEIYHQMWRKRIHHSPNTRTCKEWLLIRVNRQHELFLDHQIWAAGRESVATPKA